MGYVKRRGQRSGPLVALVVVALVGAVLTVVWAASPRDGASREAAAKIQVAASSSPAVTRAGTQSPGKTEGSPTPSPSSKAATKKPAHHSTAAAPAAPPPAGYRRVTFFNDLAQTIWVAATKANAHPLATTGWVLKPGQTININVPGKWGGRFWGRTGCSFNSKGVGHCQSGDCGGRFQCNGSGATPATLAELALGAWGGMDFYDVSMVDGSNLPMYINISHSTTKDQVNSRGCSAGGCTKPVVCPAKMQVKTGGKVVGCTTACAAYGGDAYCCRAKWSGRDHCIPSKWPVDYTKVFKRAEPYAYSYAYDDSATMACRGGCNYKITFGVT
ncbi:MAG: hypothetical protein JWN52_2944 [Actinomycetia bacterium]|nr:hypothetical protein [Actinomycetes bacterium]